MATKTYLAVERSDGSWVLFLTGMWHGKFLNGKFLKVYANWDALTKRRWAPGTSCNYEHYLTKAI